MVAAAVGAAAATAARLKNLLRWWSRLSLCSRASVCGAALPTRTTRTTSAKVKQVVHTTAGVNLNLRPVDTFCIMLPPSVTRFDPSTLQLLAGAASSPQAKHPVHG